MFLKLRSFNLQCFKHWLFFVQFNLHLHNRLLCFSKFLYSRLVAILFLKEFVSLFLQQFNEDLHQIEVSCRRNISMPLHLSQVILAHLLAVSVKNCANDSYLVFLFVIERSFVQKLHRNCCQRILRPISKPINSAAVYQGRKHTNPLLQSRSSWTHTQDNI